MNVSKQLAMGLAGAVSMILVGGSALAHQSGHGGMGHAMKAGMGHGSMAGKGQSSGTQGAGCPMAARGGPTGDATQRGMSGHGHGPAAGQGALSQDERQAFREKMRNATPEERQQLALANRTQMHKRAVEQGGDRGQGHGHRMGHGMGRGMGPMHGAQPAETQAQ